MKTLTEYINESLLKHIAITLEPANQQVLEKYGIYNGCEELADWLASNIVKQYKKTIQQGSSSFTLEYDKNELKFPNIFFNKIHISVYKSKGTHDAYYTPETTLNDDGIFDVIDIRIDTVLKNSSFYNRIRELLVHELTHAFDNYMTLLKGDEGFLDNTVRSDIYKIVSRFDKADDEDAYTLRQTLYMLNGYEVNAYVAEIMKSAKQYKKLNVDATPYDVLEYVKNSDVYAAYLYINTVVSLYFKSDEELDKLGFDETELNKMFNEMYVEYGKIVGDAKTKHKFFKHLHAQLRKVFNKIDVLIPKIFCENCIEYTVR